MERVSEGPGHDVAQVKGERVFNTREAAEFLQVHPVTLRNLAIEGKVPCRKVGREWRFSEQQLREWLAGDWLDWLKRART